MSAAVGAALKKIAVALLSNKKAIKTVGMIVLIILIVIMMPIIGVFSGGIEIDTDRLSQMVIENMSQEESAMMMEIQNTLNEIDRQMSAAGYSERVQEAQVLYVIGLSGYGSDTGFVSRLVGCFSENQTDAQLVSVVNSRFSTNISLEDFRSIMNGIRAVQIKTDNYAHYIATRDGVEMTDDTSRFLDATGVQKKEIESLLKKYPDSAELYEYADYCAKPNRANADEFVLRIAELHPEIFASRKGYVSYIANRPGAERTAGNGLFTDDGVPIILKDVMREVSEHQGNVWTHIISLRREDAQRLGYDSAADWMQLLRSQRDVFAKNMKIRPDNFRWFAAFHNEGHHPHVHMIAYSIDPNEAYLSPQGIRNIKSSLAIEIFRQDLISIYEKQTQYRDRLRQDSRDIIADIIRQIHNGSYADPRMANMLLELSKRLANTSGKKVYGYLKADVKAIVDSIVDLLEQDERVAKLYDLWYEQKYDIIRTYTDTMPPKIPLSQNKEFKSIKNAVIQEAMNLTPLLTEAQSSEQAVSASMTGVINLLYHLSRIFEDRTHSGDAPEHISKENCAEEEKRAAHGLKH